MASAHEATLKEKYPAKAHCRRVAEYLSHHGKPHDGVVYLEAQRTHIVEDDDQAMHFRQRRYFFYLSGCKLPDAHLIYNIPTDHLTLFIPPIEKDRVIWEGLPESKEEALRKYNVDEVKYTSEIDASLAELASKNNTVFAISEQVSEHISFSSFEITELESLKTAIDECRVVKDANAGWSRTRTRLR